jgi:hypothetical protein
MPANQATEGIVVSAGLLADRLLLLAPIFVHEGWSIIGILLPAIIALEFGGGLLIAAAVPARAVAVAFAIFTHCGALPLAVCRWQSTAAFPEGPCDRGWLSRSCRQDAPTFLWPAGLRVRV